MVLWQGIVGVPLRPVSDSANSQQNSKVLNHRAGKESACNAGNLGLIPGLERSPGEGKGSPLQYSGLENSMDYIIHGVAKSRTWLRDFSLHFTSTTQLQEHEFCQQPESSWKHILPQSSLQMRKQPSWHFDYRIMQLKSKILWLSSIPPPSRVHTSSPNMNLGASVKGFFRCSYDLKSDDLKVGRLS